MADDCGGENCAEHAHGCLCEGCAEAYRGQSVIRGNEAIRLGREVVTLRARVKELEQLRTEARVAKLVVATRDATLDRAAEGVQQYRRDEPDYICHPNEDVRYEIVAAILALKETTGG